MALNKQATLENTYRLQFFAFVLIYLCHMFKFNFSTDQTWLEYLYNGLFRANDIGINFLFVSLGFNMSFKLFKKLETHQELNLKKVFFQRIFKIWPLYFIIVITGFYLYPMAKQMMSISTELAHTEFYYFTLLSNFDVIPVFAGTTKAGADTLMLCVTWAIAVMEQYFIIIIPLYLLIKNHLKIWIMAILSIIAMTIVFKFMYQSNNLVISFHTLSVSYFLALGTMGGYIAYKKEKIVHWLKGKTWFHVIICIMGITTLIFFNNTKHLDRALLSLLAGIFYLYMLIQFTYKEQFWEAKNLKWAQSLGKRILGLYLLHPIALQILIIIMKAKQWEDLNNGQIFIFNIAGMILTIVLTLLSYKLIEKPIFKLKNNLIFKA